jgi:hypothetical protein
MTSWITLKAFKTLKASNLSSGMLPAMIQLDQQQDGFSHA